MPRFKFNALCMGISFLLLTSCRAHGPLVNTCVSNPDAFGLECVDTKEKAYFVHYANAQNYICYSPDDHKLITDWINAHLKRLKETEK
jgi:hypothetical protein